MHTRVFDLPIYVIDAVYAEELDDGISIESVPGEPNTDWIHIHVADPTIELQLRTLCYI